MSKPVQETIDCLVETVAHGIAIRLLGLGRGLAQQRKSRIHHGQVDEVAAENTIISPSVSIGQHLAHRHVQRRECGNTANYISSTRLFELDATLAHDLEFNGLAIDQQHGSDAILVRPHLPAQRPKSGALLLDWCKVFASIQKPTQRAKSVLVRAHEVHVDRFAVFAVAQGDGRATSEEAPICSQ